MKSRKSSGQVSRLLLILAVIVLVAAIITYLVMKMVQPAPRKTPPQQNQTTINQPVFEKQLGDIDFTFQSALDRGNTLYASQITNPQYSSSYQKDLTTTDRYIQVTVAAQNLGTANTDKGAWDIQNIVDSKNRQFTPDDDYTIAPWMPANNNCGALLRPAFQPTPCTKIYEVSKSSTGLKIRVITGQNNAANNLSSGKIDSELLDLVVQQ